MFFKGTLQDGIQTALQESKQVVCFVTDEGDESQTWENEFLAESAVKPALESRSVTLRLKAGSDEAGFLEALFPIPKKPTVVVIQNGQLKEYIAAGTVKEEFVRRLGAALGTSPTAAAAPTASSIGIAAPHSVASDRPAQVAPRTTTATAQPAVADAEEDDAQTDSGLSSSVAASSSEKPSREAKGKEKATATTDDDSKPKASGSESNHASQLRKRKQEEKDERQRILKRIEDDKRERKERDAQERQARLLLSINAAEEETPAAAPIAASTASRPIGGTTGDYCNLQVRLFDGSTLRNRFPSSGTLKDDVRAWIDADRTDGDSPYTFRIVMTPLPNKALEAAEESSTLLDLGLAPSATLVLVPVVRFASAYPGGRGSSRSISTLSHIFAHFWKFFATLFSPLAVLFTSNRGTGALTSGQQEDVPLQNLDGTGSAPTNRRIRGFQNDDDRRRDQQLYNGNSLNFEPRKDENGEEKK